VEGGVGIGLQLGIAIGQDFCLQLGKGGVAAFQLRLDLGTTIGRATGQTAHRMDAAVQFQHIAAAGLLMQAIDVLGQDCAQVAGCLQLRQCLVGRIGQGLGQAWPAEHAASPVALAGGFGLAEFAALDG